MILNNDTTDICSNSTISYISNNDIDTKTSSSAIKSTFSNSPLEKINTQYCQPSNLLPHFWFYKIVDREGRPDLPCIMILSEIFGWFKTLSNSSKHYQSEKKSLPEIVDNKLAISYDFLSEKLNFQKERIRKNIIKLEKHGFILREIKNIALENGSRINQLYISIDLDFYTSCFRNPDTDIRVGNDEIISDTVNIFKQSPSQGGDLISKENKIRSIKSNFYENNYIDNFKNKTTIFSQEPKQLVDFYPLTKEDCHELQIKSGREFTLTSMNEILKSLTKKVKNVSFWSKKGFMEYMSKVYKYEMRDAVKISGESFKIKSNMNDSKETLQIQEKYLLKLENSLQTTPEWHFKKKLAATLERNIAYNILSNYQNSERVDGVLKIYLQRK